MHYLFFILAAMAIVIYKLGALTVWFTSLSGALLAVAVISMAAIAVAAAIYTIWKRLRSRPSRLKALPKP